MRPSIRSIFLGFLGLSLGALLIAGAGLSGAATVDAAPVADADDASPVVDADSDLFQPVELGPNTTRQLQLDSVDANGSGTASLSVTQAMQAESGATEARLDRHAVENRLEAGADDPERLLAAAMERFGERIADLEERESATRDEFRAGDVGPEVYLSTLGAVNREARAYEDTLDAYEAMARDYPAIENRLDAQLTETVRYTGPLATEAGAAVAGEEDMDEIYVSVSNHGMALSAMRDGSYVREIMRTDARDGSVGGVDLDAAQTRIATLYPWAWDNKGDVSINTVGNDVIRFQLSHDHGVLNSLLDTSSDNVYREIQELSLAGLPVAPGPTKTVNNSTLQVSAPEPGAPLRIQVVNETGVPVEATITAANETLGTADEEPVWLLTPSEPFTVTAETETETLELAVNPTRR